MFGNFEQYLKGAEGCSLKQTEMYCEVHRQQIDYNIGNPKYWI